MRTRVLALCLAALSLAIASLAAPQRGAHAAFPGANGKIAFSSYRYDPDTCTARCSAQIYVMNPDGTGVTRLTNNTANDLAPSWSPDGSKIAFHVDYDAPDVYVMNADGSGVTQLTYAGDDYGPAWSPDGSKIAFASSSGGVSVMNADGSGVTALGAGGHDPAWSPDGSKIAFATGSGISVMYADGSGVTRLTIPASEDQDYRPAWSPGGTKIAFTSYRGGNYEIYVMNADGSGQTRLTNNATYDTDPAWSPDGSKIAFQRVDPESPEGTLGHTPEVYVMNADGSGQTNLTNNPAIDVDPDWQPFFPRPGDVNCGGDINSIDAVLVLQLSAGLVAALACDQNADVNGDGSIDSRDAALILQYAAGLLHSLPR
jgi:Tol biopolymer transport system component